MQRWHLTVGLFALALAATALAPRLFGAHAPNTPPVSVAPPPPTAPVSVEPTTAPVHLGHLTLTAGLDHTAVLAGSGTVRFLTITIDAPKDLGRTIRHPLDVAVVLDASGSMSARGKIDYAKRAAKLVASAMESGDRFTLVTFNDDATTIVPATSVHDPAVIHRAIDRIYEGGGTNLYAGLSEAASQVQSSLQDGGVGRVILLSDGNANVGITDPTAIRRFVGELASSNITLSTVGLGLDYNEDLLAQMSDLGGGSYDFVDDPRDLEGVFADELARSTQIIARDTQILITLPPEVQPLELIGWSAERNEQGWAVNIGDVYAGSSRKIVARVRVQAPKSTSALDVATVRANYTDLIDDTSASSFATASAQLTSDPSRVASSVDHHRAVIAQRAWGNTFLDRSARAYAKGDVVRAQQLAGEGAAVLAEASEALGEERLAFEGMELQNQATLYERHRPASPAGRRAIKKGKEMFRGRSR